MTEAIYRKVQHGKRVSYELIGNARGYYDTYDILKPGQFRLEFASGDGTRRYAYPVSPDTAGWEAAALLARCAMEAEIKRAAQCVPDVGRINPYTKKQMAIGARYQAEMQATGAQLPQWWRFTSDIEISQAAIDAVRSYRP